MKLNTWIAASVVAVGGLVLTADSAKAQYYNSGYNYGYTPRV